MKSKGVSAKAAAEKAGKKFMKLGAKARASLKTFSYAFVLLVIFPMFLMLLFILILAEKFDYISIQGGLFVFLAALAALYLLLPHMASRVLESIMLFRPAKKNKGALKLRKGEMYG
ncbi:MAG: hypothetical protein AABW99_03545 [archaeon]